MDEMQAQILQQVLATVGTVLAALLSWASAEAIHWIRKKRRAGYVQDAAIRFVTLADIVVARGMQRQVKQAKAKAEDGKLTAEEGKRLLDAAVRDVLEYAGRDMIEDLERVVEPNKVRKMAEDAIEAAVLRWKSRGQS